MANTNQKPPTPPSLPPQHEKREKMSVALKVRMAPPGWAYDSHVQTRSWDFLTPPAGKYFFYGTLQDPQMLRQILGLSSVPKLQPAHLIGYRTRLWGQYPAVVKKPGAVLEGSMFDVPDEQSAQKLADYETKNYRPTPCIIRLNSDGAEEVDGYVFEYCGNMNDLGDGSFDLNTWLSRVGRRRLD